MRAIDKCGVYGCNKPRMSGTGNYACEEHNRERWRIAIPTVLRVPWEKIVRIYVRDYWWDVARGTLRFEREHAGDPYRAVALFRSVPDGDDHAVLIGEIIAVDGLAD